MPLERLQHLITLTQHATDLLLNEIERRGELTFHEDGAVIVPYMSDYGVETILLAARAARVRAAVWANGRTDRRRVRPMVNLITALLRLLAAVLDFINKHDGWPFDE